MLRAPKLIPKFLVNPNLASKFRFQVPPDVEKLNYKDLAYLYARWYTFYSELGYNMSNYPSPADVLNNIAT